MTSSLGGKSISVLLTLSQRLSSQIGSILFFFLIEVKKYVKIDSKTSLYSFPLLHLVKEHLISCDQPQRGLLIKVNNKLFIRLTFLKFLQGEEL